MTCTDGVALLNQTSSLGKTLTNGESHFKLLNSDDRTSVIFLLCSDVNVAQSLIKANDVNTFINWLSRENYIESHSTVSRDLYEAIQQVQHFRILRYIQPFSKDQGLCPVRTSLYKLCDSLTNNETKKLKELFGISNDGLLEEHLLGLEKKGIIQFLKNISLNALYKALHDCGLDEAINDLKGAEKITNCQENAEFYNIENSNDIGWCVIINESQFYRGNDDDVPDEDLPPRPGSECDVIALHETFTRLNFKVKVHSDLPKSALLRLLQSYSKRVPSNHSMIIIVILSHGSEDVVYAADSLPIQIDHIEMLFQGQNCMQLLGKPKIFIIQACQGKEWQKIETDGVGHGQVKNKIIKQGPQKGDALIAWSTVRGFASFRDRLHGSWFIQALCRELDASSEKRDFLDILTRVNLTLRSQTHRQQFMVPWIASSLCKKIKFKTES